MNENCSIFKIKNKLNNACHSLDNKQGRRFTNFLALIALNTDRNNIWGFMKKIVLILLSTMGLCISAASDEKEVQKVPTIPSIEDMLMERLNPTLIGDSQRAQIALHEKYPEFSQLISVDGIIQEARETYGIDLQKALPIKDMDPQSAEAQLNLGHVTHDAVVLNRDKLNQLSHGVSRIAIFHEISHEHDGDHQKIMSLPTPAGLAAAVTSLACFLKKAGLSRKSMWALPVAAGTFFAVQRFVDEVIQYYIEHKADTEGIKLAACFQCAKEFALQKKTDAALYAYQKEISNFPLSYKIQRSILTNRYLSAEEVERLALTLKGKKCKAHQLMDEYPVIEQSIEHMNSVTCDVLNARKELLIKEKIARLHEKQSEGPLLPEAV